MPVVGHAAAHDHDDHHQDDADRHDHDHDHEGQTGLDAGVLVLWVGGLVLVGTLLVCRGVLREAEIGRLLGALRVRLLGARGPKPEGLKAF